MSLWLDITFLNQIAPRLERFKLKRPNSLWNLRCMMCGDSAKKANKARGYFFAKGNVLLYSCHNCGATMSFDKFLKSFDPNLHHQYLLEKFKENTSSIAPKPKLVSDDKTVLQALSRMNADKNASVPHSLSGAKAIKILPDSHPARQYLTNRKIPEQFFGEIFYADEFCKWAANYTDRFVGRKHDHPRIILPWFDPNNKMFSFSARSLGKEEPRYYNVVLDSSVPKFYGMNRLDISKQVYVIEGQFDSLFIPNCVAVGNAALYHFDEVDDTIYIPDRDIRNEEVMKYTKKMIDLGLRVCMLPLTLNGKDINEIVVNHGLTQSELIAMIESNTYSGLSANLHFTKWKKTF